MTMSNITQNGQVTVAVDMRKALGPKTGSKVRFRRRGKRLFLEAVVDPEIESLFGVLRVGKGKGIVDMDAAINSVRTSRPVASRRTAK